MVVDWDTLVEKSFRRLVSKQQPASGREVGIVRPRSLRIPVKANHLKSQLHATPLTGQETNGLRPVGFPNVRDHLNCTQARL